MIAGWFTAKLLNQYSVKQGNSSDLVEIYIKKLDKKLPFPNPLIARKPQPSDLLASILLSTPLAIGSYFNSDDEALEPYRRLIELGTSGDGVVGAYNSVNQELQELVKDSSLEDILDKLNKWKNNNANLRKEPLVQRGVYNRYPSIGWEIGIRVAEVLSRMISTLENLKTQDPEDF